MVGFWPLNNEHEGADLSGHGNNITFHDVTFTNDAVVFRGENSSYGEILASQSLHLQYKITWMAEYYPETNSGGPLFDWFAPLYWEGWSFQIWYFDIGLFVNPSIDSALSDYAQGSSPIITGQWNKIGMSINSHVGVIKMNINGEEKRFENPGWIGEISPTNVNVYIGHTYVCFK